MLLKWGLPELITSADVCAEVCAEENAPRAAFDAVGADEGNERLKYRIICYYVHTGDACPLLNPESGSSGSLQTVSLSDEKNRKSLKCRT